MGEETGFEVVIVVPKRRRKEEGDEIEKNDCVEFLVRELKNAGLIVERFRGVPAEFLKVFVFRFFFSVSLINCLLFPFNYFFQRNRRRSFLLETSNFFFESLAEAAETSNFICCCLQQSIPQFPQF